MQIILPEDIEQHKVDVKHIGGKAFNLWRMQKQGFPVPGFVVVPADTIQQLLAPLQKEVEQICAGLQNKSDTEIHNEAGKIQQQLAALKIPDTYASELLNTCNARFGENFRVAVRSSAIAEDSANISFAGQHASIMYVDANNLNNAITTVMASGWSVSALKYRIIHKLPLTDIRFAVVIQLMVPAEKSGIGFSMNLKGNMADMILVAGYGLGEGIVSDQAEADAYTVNRQLRTIDAEIKTKETALIYKPGSGVVPVAVEKERQHLQVLSDEQIFEVCDYMAKAEKLLKAPADIEFSYDETGKLYLLQMRPVTTLNRDRIKIIDNTNIVESYPGITLPLTYSFVLMAYEKVFAGSSKAFMISAETIRQYAPVFENLLAHFNGRIYYRLDNWYRMLALVHNSRKSMEAWENAVGLMSSESDKVNFSFRGKVRTIAASAKLIVNYKRGNKAFFKRFQSNYALLQDYTKNSASPAALWNHYEKTTALLFEPWHLTIVNDFLAFKGFGWLQDLLKRYKIGENGALANDLLCGVGGVESEEAILRVLELKEQIKNEAALSSLFELPVSEIWIELQQEKYSPFYQQVHRYLEKYGDRTLAELKLETKSLRRNPEQFIGMLKNQLLSATTAADFRKKQEQIRTAAEAQVNEKLSALNPKKKIFNTVLKLARYGLQNRENMRFCRTRAYSAVKDIFLEVGKMMVAQNIIEVADDVFYLSISDLKSFCTGGNTESKVVFIAEQKEKFHGYESLVLPDRVIYMDDDLPVFDHNNKQVTSDAVSFKGIAVSKGVINAEAVVVTEPKLDLDVHGRILISKMTDPGWIFLMAQAAGLVSEKGSLLSHTAIVGRELGIPVVVGVTGATSVFKTGDALCLDGNAGTVAFTSKNNP